MCRFLSHNDFVFELVGFKQNVKMLFGFIRIFVWVALDLDVKIRQESAEDSAEVLEVVRLAFGRSVESQLVEKFRQNPNYVTELSLVAEYEGHICLLYT